MTSPFQFSGSLTDVPLGDVLRLLQSTGRTGCLSLNCPGGSGGIYFIDGAVVEAQSSQLSGRDAIKLLAVFNQGSFEFSNEPPKIQALLADSTDEFIEIIEGRALEATQIRELIPGEDQVPLYVGGSLPADFELTASELAIAMKASGGMLSVGQLSSQLGLEPLLVGYSIARFRALGLIDFRIPDEVSTKAPEAQWRPFLSPAPALPSNRLEAKPRYWRGRLIK